MCVAARKLARKKRISKAAGTPLPETSAMTIPI